MFCPLNVVSRTRDQLHLLKGTFIMFYISELYLKEVLLNNLSNLFMKMKCIVLVMTARTTTFYA
jgi:hypothetical protein